MPYDSLPVPWFSFAVEAHYLLIYYSLLFLYVFSEILRRLLTSAICIHKPLDAESLNSTHYLHRWLSWWSWDYTTPWKSYTSYHSRTGKEWFAYACELWHRHLILRQQSSKFCSCTRFSFHPKFVQCRRLQVQKWIWSCRHLCIQQRKRRPRDGATSRLRWCLDNLPSSTLLRCNQARKQLQFL